MRSLGPLAALLVLLAAAPAGAQPKTAIEKGSTVKIDYTLKDDKGEVIDSSTGKEPLAFKQGAQQIIPGLDRALLGMKVGDTKKVVVKPEEAYGKVDPKAEAEVPKEALPEGAAVVGTRLMARGQDGNPHPVTVKVVKDKTVVLDLNHPLAGKTLVFDIKVVSIERTDATPLPGGRDQSGLSASIKSRAKVPVKTSSTGPLRRMDQSARTSISSVPPGIRTVTRP